MFGNFSAADLASDLSPQDRAELRRLWFEAPPVWSYAATGQDPDAMAEWLGALRPDDWHEIVLRFDWDGGDIAPIAFIAGRPNADRATILSILLEQDVRFFEDIRRLRPDDDPRQLNPEGALLLDLISQGFAAGYYAESRFGLVHDANVLPRTRAFLAALDGDPLWTLPDRAWDPCDGTPHLPDFVWDHAADCQRLSFEDWLQCHLRPI